MKILVLCEIKESLKETGKLILSESSREVLKFAISSTGTENVSAILFGESLANASEEVVSLGVRKLFKAESNLLKFFSSEIYSQEISKILNSEKYDFLLASHSADSEMLLGILAAKHEANLATDCLSLDINERLVTRSMYSNKLFLKSSLSEGKASFISFRPNSLRIESELSKVNTEIVNLEIASINPRIKCIEFKEAASKEPSLSEAGIIISGGRAMGNSENFQILRACAAKIGAAVGASRAAVDSGYAPHSMQVGQTGKVVSPNLYIACGISGAIQHFAGMGSSKVIVAINTDKDAPILKKADYAVIGDLFEVVPALTELLS